MKLNRHILKFGLVMCVVHSFAFAGEKGFHTSFSAMMLNSSTQQGGDGPQGSTLLTHTDIIYNIPYVGAGLFAQYDWQGSSEKDLIAGPKIEIHYGPFYWEGGYLALVSRTFSDRAIAGQTGSGWYMGIGVRFSISLGFLGVADNDAAMRKKRKECRKILSIDEEEREEAIENEQKEKEAAAKGWFIQASYKYRVQTIKHQDGVELSETITQTDGYPVFGIGYSF